MNGLIRKVNRICPACGKGCEGEVLYSLKMKVPEDYRISGRYDIVSCVKCGNCYADTESSEFDYDTYYANHNHYGGWKGNSSSKHDINAIVRLLGGVVDKNAEIIDVGFGNGKLLLELKKRGFNHLIGIDPSANSVSELIELGIEAKVGSIYDKVDGINNTADVVVFTMVLEHLLNPDKAIIAIRDNLLKNEDSYIVITWPFFEDLIADGSPIVNNFNHEHINYFSRNTADILFNRMGFENVGHHVSLGVDNGIALQFSNVSVYKKNENVHVEIDSKDLITKKSIVEYTSRLSVNKERINTYIESVLRRRKKVVIWGSGSYLFYLMGETKISECDIDYFVDNNPSKQGAYIYEHIIKSPSELKKFEGVVIVTAMLYANEIEQQIKELNNDKIEVVLAF